MFDRTKAGGRRPSSWRIAALVVVMGSSLALSACSSSPSSSSSTTVASGHTIVIRNFAFSPKELRVAPGTVVTVDNEDMVTHTLTATGGGGFNTGDIGSAQSKTFTAPASAGTYHYICSIHTYMMGTLVVS
jgi:plastocyanin